MTEAIAILEPTPLDNTSIEEEVSGGRWDWCPDCDSQLQHGGGCHSCPACGFSVCG